MIEHISVPVRNFPRAKAFYRRALKPLGYKMNMVFPGAAGFMAGGHTSFWIVKKARGAKIHVAFLAKNKKAVEAFYEAGIRAGGQDNGKPGFRKEYSPDYYAAFVNDEEGNSLEAVCFGLTK